MSHHPPPPLHFKSSFTISALYHSLSLPVCLLLVFHTHRHLSSPYLSFHALLTVNLFSCLVPHLAVLHFLFFPSVLSTAPSGHRSSFLWISMVSVHTQGKKHSVSYLGSRVCGLPAFYRFLLPSQSNFLPSPSLCVSLQAANGE